MCNGGDTKLSGSGDIPEPNAELAQYFTPKNVVFALWHLVQKRFISQATQEIRAIDLAAGAGVWLDVLIDSGTVRPGDAYGIEIDQRWADRSGVPYTGDGLLGVFDGVENDTFDVVVGNPPFGRMSNFCAAMGGPDSRMLAERFPLWQGLGENRDSYPIELLFVERALQVLRPGGWGVLVLPEGILANAKLQSARDQLLRDLTLKLIIELPLSVFRSKGLNAKTSAVIFKKGCEGRRHSVGLYKARFEVQQPTVSAFLAQVERGKGPLLSACRVGQSSFSNKRWDVGYWRGISLVRQLNRRFPTQSLGSYIEHLTYGPIVTGRKPNLVEEGTPIIRQGDIVETGLDETGLMQVESCSEFDPERSRVRAGDLLFPRSGVGALGRNRMAVYAGLGKANVGCFVDLVRLSGINPYYAWLFFKTSFGWGQISALINGVGTPNINFGEIRSLQIVQADGAVQSVIEARYRREVLPWHCLRDKSPQARVRGENAFRVIVNDLQRYVSGELSERALVEKVCAD